MFIDREVVSSRHGRDVVDGLNSRVKQILKLEMTKQLNYELILYDPNFSSS